jgi:hypothetical protein
MLLGYIPVALLVSLVLGGIMSMFAYAVPNLFSMIGEPLLRLLTGIFLSLLTPLFSLYVVLVYYDQRVRLEAYDIRALSEDLMR